RSGPCAKRIAVAVAAAIGGMLPGIRAVARWDSPKLRMVGLNRWSETDLDERGVTGGRSSHERGHRDRRDVPARDRARGRDADGIEQSLVERARAACSRIRHPRARAPAALRAPRRAQPR